MHSGIFLRKSETKEMETMLTWREISIYRKRPVGRQVWHQGKNVCFVSRSMLVFVPICYFSAVGQFTQSIPTSILCLFMRKKNTYSTGLLVRFKWNIHPITIYWVSVMCTSVSNHLFLVLIPLVINTFSYGYCLFPGVMSWFFSHENVGDQNRPSQTRTGGD